MYKVLANTTFVNILTDVFFRRSSIWMSHVDPVRERKDHCAQICQDVCGGSRKTRYGLKNDPLKKKNDVGFITCLAD